MRSGGMRRIAARARLPPRPSTRCARCPAARGCSTCSPDVRGRGSSAARSATCCSVARRASSTSSSRAIRSRSRGAGRGRGLPRALRHRDVVGIDAVGGRLRLRRGDARAPSATRQPGALPDVRAGDAGGGPAAPRLHRQRDRARQPPASCAPRPRALEDLEAGRLRVLHDRVVPRRPDAAVAAGPLRGPARLRARARHRRLACEAVQRGALETVSGDRARAPSCGSRWPSPTRWPRCTPRRTSGSCAGLTLDPAPRRRARWRCWPPEARGRSRRCSAR